MKQGRPKGGMSAFTRKARELIDAEELIKVLTTIANDPEQSTSDRISAASKVLAKAVPDLKSQEMVMHDGEQLNLTPDEQLAVRQYIRLLRQEAEIPKQEAEPLPLPAERPIKDLSKSTGNA